MATFLASLLRSVTFVVASIVVGYYLVEMWQQAGQPESKQPTDVHALIEKLLKRKKHPGELHTCPICGGQLRIRFEPYTLETGRMLGIIAECDGCDVVAAYDGDGTEVPIWLQE